MFFIFVLFFFFFFFFSSRRRHTRFDCDWSSDVCSSDLFFANFTDLGHTGWLSHRLLTVLPVIASQYYIWTRYRDSGVSTRERNAARLYLYAAAIGAVVLSRFELGRVLTVIGWAAIVLALYAVGSR